MGYRISIGAMAIAAALAITFAGAQAFDDAKYPDMKGQWNRVGPPNWQAVLGAPPLTPEYQEVYKANRADMANGGPGDVPSWYCLPQGMPMMMNIYDPMEIVITPDITYILISHVNDSYRRVYTDGRDWPAEDDYELTYAGYSIGKWVDENADGKYDVLEVETRNFKGPRTYENSGMRLHDDNESVVKERFFLDKANPDLLKIEITTIDHALTRPWTITKTFRRNRNVMWGEYDCAESNNHVQVGKEYYFLSADGYLMPTRKDQPPPDPRYFKTAK